MANELLEALGGLIGTIGLVTILVILGCIQQDKEISEIFKKGGRDE